MVEAMGMVPVASLHEVENLSGKMRRIFLLENADRVDVNVPKISIYHQDRDASPRTKMIRTGMSQRTSRASLPLEDISARWFRG